MEHGRENLLTLDSVSRVFDGGTIAALTGVSLHIGPNELVAIHGASGSGKSTLLNLMAGLDTPSSGRVLFNGASPTQDEWTRLRASNIGIVFQEFNLLPTLSAAENVEVAMFGAGTRAQARQEVALARLGETGIAYCAERLPPTLSGGERQRVSIARSLANAPALLLADEPTSSLDSKAGADVLDLLLALHRNRKLTLVIVTHDRTVIARCPRRVRLSDGKIVEDVHD
jgi:putative ABC transport system ATP-binding protein